jgi:predicted ester cyclase
MMFAGFPDLRWTLHDTLVEDDRVMGFSTWTGTHEGEFMGIPATGRTATVQAWTIDRYRDGIFVESRIIMDVAGLLGQLGVLPAPGIA